MNIWKCLLVGLGIAAAGLLAMLGDRFPSKEGPAPEPSRR
jgi:hypothetical protein